LSASANWLTVVTVVKDDPQGLEVTLDSLQQQNLAEVEYIVIDSSRDRTAVVDLVNSRGIDKSVVHWVEPEGIYAAMNQGVQISSGEYIYFANAGDAFASPNVLSNIHEVIVQQAPDWLMGPIEIREQSGRVVTSPQWDFAEEQSRLFARGLFAPHQGTFVRTSVVRNLGGFDTTFEIGADYALFLRLTQLSDPAVVDFPIARFSEGGASTINWKKSFREFHRARREILTPTGLESVREYTDTVEHYSKVSIVKTLRALRLKR
jgi:glycosyltransferase involved in cell wall biosynthesis